MSLCELLSETAREFRTGKTGYANQHYVEVVEAIQKILVGNELSEAQKQELVPIIGALLDAQARNDHVWLADLLEYAVAYYLQCPQ